MALTEFKTHPKVKERCPNKMYENHQEDTFAVTASNKRNPQTDH